MLYYNAVIYFKKVYKANKLILFNTIIYAYKPSTNHTSYFLFCVYYISISKLVILILINLSKI